MNDEFRILALIAIYPKEWEAFKQLVASEDAAWERFVDAHNKENGTGDAASVTALGEQLRAFHARVFRQVDYLDLWDYAKEENENANKS